MDVERCEERVLLSSGLNTFARFDGELTTPGQQDTIPLQISLDDFTMPALEPGDLPVPAGVPHSGFILLGFAMRATEGSSLDPGLIRVIPRDNAYVHGGGLSTPNTAGSSTSLTLARVSEGTYDIVVRAEKGTLGSYHLDVFLAGDANADFQVDQQDLNLIASLDGTKRGDPGYSVDADVDRNGVINGGDVQWARRNLGASTTLRLGAENPLDELLDPGALSLTGVVSDGFNPVSAPLRFQLAGADFYPDPADVSLRINGATVPISKLTVEPNVITATSVLVEGRNDISLSAYDTVGRSLYLNTTIWAGTRTLAVTLVNENGQLFTDTADVVAMLSDDTSFTSHAVSTSGQVLFHNVPNRTILVQATASDNRFGLTGVVGSQGGAQVKMIGLNAPSTIDNNDFSQGTAGWNIGSAPVQIIPHIEGFPGQAGLLSVATASASPLDRGSYQPAEESDLEAFSPATVTAMATNNDLRLSTSGLGERSISRTFNTAPGTTSVRVRYRFITSEVPGGYFGSQYNDYFRVTIRSLQGGGFAGESNSMNGLGLAAFDYASGATDWRNATLAVNSQGDTIQVDVAVANVGDGAFDSHVVIDFIDEEQGKIQPTLTWNNTQGGLNLTYNVVGQALEEPETIRVYWASGPNFANRLGEINFTHTVSAGTQVGNNYGPIHINGQLLRDAPTGTTHIIVASNEANASALLDVSVGFGTNANQGAVSAYTIGVVKELLRIAGQPAVTITSTARTPEDQARAMFNNLIHPGDTLDQVNTRIDQQRNGIPGTNFTGYAAAGDAVIDVFEQQIQGLTPAQILANRQAIEAAMVQEINNQGPGNVSRHCADPTILNVIDVGIGVGQLFFNAADNDPRVSRVLNEPNNGCYHLEIPQ